MKKGQDKLFLFYCSKEHTKCKCLFTLLRKDFISFMVHLCESEMNREKMSGACNANEENYEMKVVKLIRKKKSKDSQK